MLISAVPGLVLPFVIGADYFIEMNGTDLLADYRNTGSEGAFSELVRRYTNLVYSIAKRRVSNGPLAEEVTQTVFTRLAKATPKAKGDAELVAWLHRTTVHVAIDFWRSETRRRTREQHAAAMEPPESAQLWDEIAPNLDEALNQLNHSDRQAVLLRYFERKPMRDIARILGVSEDAAKMRLSRAIDRLRSQLKLRGVTCAAGALSGLLAERSVEAAPSQLVANLSAANFTAGAATTLGAFTLLLTFISKAKISSALVVLAAVSIGVVGTFRIMNSGTSSSHNIVATGGTQAFNAILPSSRALGRGAGKDAAAEAARTPDSAELEDLKRELRALLNKPQAGKGYPPPEITGLLTRFGAQLHEAAPILIEALSAQDYETRACALSGLTHALNLMRPSPDLEDRASQVFTLARPVLSKILVSPDEPSMLRLLAVHSYIAPVIYENGAPIGPPVPLGAEGTADLLAALRIRDKFVGGNRYLIVSRLAEHFGQYQEDAATFVSALQPLLSDSDPHERLLAAFALASWPGEKPPALKEVLLNEIKARTTDHSYIAAQALGKLGAQAADAVPDLIAYAQATKGWTGGYAESALEAACRLQPDLRAQYPAIDAKLKQEEGVFSHPAETQKSAIDAVRQIDTSIKSEETWPPPISMTSLVLEARLLLQESDNPNESGLEHALDEFHVQHIRNVKDANATTERCRVLSDAIRDIDPAFHATWRKQVLKNYPWLDRVLPLEKE